MAKISSLKFGNNPYFLKSQNILQSQNAQNNARQEAKQELINKNYNEIYTHEMAHKLAGGHLAGGIVIERNQDGIPIAGHVPIKMPALNPDNPKKTAQDADTVIRAAMAPSDPSSQDYKVAAQARDIKSQALDMENKKKKGLNILA